MNVLPWRRRSSLVPSSSGFDDFFNRFWNPGEEGLMSRLPEVFQSRGFPAMNFAESEAAFTITMDCPGLELEDFRVETLGNNVVISGERKWEEEKQDKEFHRVESQYGRFERSIPLPENVRIEPGEVEATYKKGVLTIEIPKIERTPAARIDVKVE